MPADTYALVTLAFVVVSTMVAAAALPGNTRLLLGHAENVDVRARLVGTLVYLLWLGANALLALVLWGALFPARSPKTLVAYSPEIATTPACGAAALDTRCMQARLTLARSAGSEIDPEDWARALLAENLESSVSDVPARHLVVNEDLLAYAAALQVPLRHLIVVADTSGPSSKEGLSSKWPWLRRYLDRSPRDYSDIVQRADNVSQCLVAAKATDGPDLRFCLLPPILGGRVQSAGAFVNGEDLIVEAEGTPLPDHIHLRFRGSLFAEPTPRSYTGSASRFASVRFPGLKWVAAQYGELEVGHGDGNYTYHIPLPLATRASTCLLVEGKSAPEVEKWRDSIVSKAGFDSESGAAVGHLLPASDRCTGTLLYVASNGTIVIGKDQSDESLVRLASLLAPASQPFAAPARVLDPNLDTAPGLLDDIRLAKSALTVSEVVATPLVIREIPYGSIAFAMKGYQDHKDGSLVSQSTGLAPIVAWIEGVQGAASRPVLAGSFGTFLAPAAEAAQLRASWGAALAMLRLHDGAVPMTAPQVERTDAIGVALEAAADARRQRIVFLVLAGWMLLAVLLRSI